MADPSRVYARCLAAYLSGWLIVQPLYNRLHGAWRRRQLGNPGPETAAYFRRQAEAVVDVMEERGHLVRPARDVRQRGDG